MKPLSELYADLDRDTKTANLHLSDYAYGERMAMSTAKIQAKLRVDETRKLIEAELFPSKLVGLYISGNCEEAVSFISKNGGIAVDANKVYKVMTAQVEPSYGRDKDFGPTQWSLMASVHASLWGSFGQDRFPPDYTVKQIHETTLLHIKRTVTAWEGSELAVLVAKGEILEEIVKKKLTYNQILVVLTGVESDKERKEFNKLFSRTVDFAVPEGFVANKASINKLLKNKAETEE